MFQNSGIHQGISASCYAADQENKQAQNSANIQESTKSSELAVRSALMQLETPPKVCNICGKTFTSVMKYHQHKIIHKEKRYACEVCSHKFHFPSHLRLHIRSHTGERPFSCEQCGYRFTQKEHMIRHIRTMHNLQPGDLKNSPNNEILDGVSATNNAEDQENKQPDNSANIQEFTKTPKMAAKSAIVKLLTPPNTCDICGKMFLSERKCAQHKLIHKEKNYECDLCSYKTYHRTRFRKHIMSHTGERPFRCEWCGNRYSSNFMRKRHIRTQHDVQSNDLINKMMSSDKILFDATANSTQEVQVNKQPNPTVHIQESTQFAEEAMKSLKTQARFKQKHDESEHIKVHHTALSYTCIICNKSFSSLPHLNEHMLNHICIICGVAFASDSELLTHFNSSLHLLK